MRGWITSLAYRSMNVQCFSVHHKSIQHPSKANTVYMRVTSNGENVPQVGVNLRGSNATMEIWSPPLSTGSFRVKSPKKNEI